MKCHLWGIQWNFNLGPANFGPKKHRAGKVWECCEKLPTVTCANIQIPHQQSFGFSAQLILELSSRSGVGNFTEFSPYMIFVSAWICHLLACYWPLTFYSLLFYSLFLFYLILFFHFNSLFCSISLWFALY